MKKQPASNRKLYWLAACSGVLGTVAGTLVGAIPGMLVYRAAIQSGGFIMEYALMFVTACSMWCSSILMSIVTASISNLSRAKRVRFVTLSLIPGAALWIGFGLISTPIWFRTAGALVGAVIGAASLIIPLVDPSEHYES